ncbi:UNVERIFIED_CONTAM: hypothetical protein PYX00_000124 [Menopon gallinae]|uniref:ATPase AAA-type core domain-containing protein n=1 Tax=Menopon gallinae TaxID=328185 RepID=A0AAW2I919_9NEOP
MSNEYYLDLWKEAQHDLRKNLAYDRQVKSRGVIKDLNTAKWLVGHLFMGYVRIVNKLDECYDQITHPQKRELIGRLLDCSLGRLLEIKRDIVRLESDDYAYFDNVLMELKLTPDDVQITVPKYFWRDRQKSQEERKILIKTVYEELRVEEFKNNYLKAFPPEKREEEWQKHLIEMENERREREKLEELQRKRMAVAVKDSKQDLSGENDETVQKIVSAVLLIQRHERARQSRRRLIQNKRSSKKKTEDELPEDTANHAATVIQRHWRRHRRRLNEHRRMEKQMALLGMTQASWRDLSFLNKIEEALRKKWAIQERNQEEYENALEVIKDKMKQLYSMSMEEDTTDEIRGWFDWYFKQGGYLPDYPGEKLIVPTDQILGIPKKIPKEFVERLYPGSKNSVFIVPKSRLAMKLTGTEPIGGSALVTAGVWIGPKEYRACQAEMVRMKKGGGGEKKLSKAERAAKRKAEKEAEKKRLAAEEAEGFRIRDGEFYGPLAKAEKDYRDYWLDLDETKNYEQRFIYDLVKDEKCWELSMEIRKVVDEAMRLELEVLKDALQKDQNPKKKRKRKKPKKPKGEKKKKKKDPTEDRTVDDLFTELFKNGIIREYEEAHLKDYIGERSYSAFELRNRLQDAPPCMGDVKDLILQLCILPLGSRRIHQLSPVTRSVCLIGPEHSGKEFLARIVCTETAAVLFDLTPENTAGKYEGAANLRMLLHLVEKLSRLLQPSVILVDGAEKLFYKKVPKDQKKFEPKRLGKMLTKIVKGIKQDDQVLVLGISSFPWLCPKVKLVKTYDKFIFVPQPDYGTYLVIWQKLLTRYHGLPKDFDFSCLARVSTGYSLRTIMDVVEAVLTPKRIVKSKVDPYKPEEFLKELITNKPVAPKILAKINGFYNKTALRKKRLAHLKELREAYEKNRLNR